MSVYTDWLRGRPKKHPLKVRPPQLLQILAYASSEMLRKKKGIVNLAAQPSAGGRLAATPSSGGGRTPVNPAGGGRGRSLR
jgi:hypothetical protein